MKKVFKTVFILSLCLVINIPTYCAISVGDGSAFMTKSEFYADISNLSTRISALEQNIDADIDSKVETYLTDFGNTFYGHEQTLATSGSAKLINLPTTVGDSESTNNTTSFDIVTSTSISGLCDVVYTCTPNSYSKPLYGATFTFSGSDYSSQRQYYISLEVDLSFIENPSSGSAVTRAVVPLFSSTGRCSSVVRNQGNSAVATFVVTDSIPSVQSRGYSRFFVGQNSKLSCKVFSRIVVAEYNGSNPTGRTFNFTTQQYSTFGAFNILINKVTIL